MKGVAKMSRLNFGKENEMNGKKKYIITVTKNPDFCGIGAAGLQFAHGKAVTASERAAAWYREHEGYAVEEAGEKERRETEKAKKVAKTEKAETVKEDAQTEAAKPDTAKEDEEKKEKSKK